MRLPIPILTVAASGSLVAVTVIVTAAVGASAAGPTPLAGSPSGPRTVLQASAPDYLFPSGAGMLFFYVRPDRATDFETVMARLRVLLAASADPVRQQQAASWRAYRSLEARDERLFVFAFDPAVRDAAYDPVRLLSELAPSDVGDLYATLKAAIIRVERMGLERVQ